MAPAGQLLSGAEYVLVARVPKAGGRWAQVGFNLEVAKQFFRLEPGAEREITVERVDGEGQLSPPVKRKLRRSAVNKNPRIEFDFRDESYPAKDFPLLLVLELSLRSFRYMLLLPGDAGYGPMLRLNTDEQAVGKGLKRVIATLDEVEIRWPECPLRSPSV